MNAVQRLSVVLVALSILAPTTRAEDKKVQSVKGWGEVMDPDGDCIVAEKDGKLTITVPGKYHDLWVGKKVNAPCVLQEIEGDFSMQVLVTGVVHPEKGTLIPKIASTVAYQAGGLVIWKDEHTIVRLERGAMVRESRGEFSTYCYLQAFADDARYAEPRKKKIINDGKGLEEKDTLLRLERKEGKIFAASSQDGGKSWRDLPDSGFAMDLPAKLKVGVMAIQSTTKDFAAEFKDFKLTMHEGEASAIRPELVPNKKTVEGIVGKWASKSDGTDVVMTFTKDGGYEVTVGDKSFKGGTYQFLDDATIETKMNDQTTKMKVSLSGDTLAFDLKGTKSTFKRVKDK